MWSCSTGLARAHIDCCCVSRIELWWRSCYQRSGKLLECCLSKHQQWLSPPHPGTRFPLYPKVECLPQLWLPQIQCCTVAWSEENWRVCSAWAGIYSEVVLGNPTATREDLSLHCLEESHCAYSSRVQVSHSLSIYPSSPPTIQGGLSPLHMTPGQGCPIYGLTTHSPGQVSTCVISFFL